MKRFAYARAGDLEAARSLLSAGARPLAGGTDLLTLIKAGLEAPEALVYLRGLPGFDGVEVLPDGGLRVGALVTLAELAAHPEVRLRHPALAEAALSSATPQLRNMGTLGGNLLQQPRCWYYRNGFGECLLNGGARCACVDGENALHAIFANDRCAAVHPSDPAVALVAYDARVVVRGPSGDRVLPVGELFVPAEAGRGRLHRLEPDELLVEVLLPPLPPGARARYRKAMNRAVWAFALASVAAVATLDADGAVRAARVVLGGVAYRPWRAEAAEEALLGHPLSDEAIERAAGAAVAGARPLSGNAYKVDLVRGIVRETLLALR